MINISKNLKKVIFAVFWQWEKDTSYNGKSCKEGKCFIKTWVLYIWTATDKIELIRKILGEKKCCNLKISENGPKS